MMRGQLITLKNLKKQHKERGEKMGKVRTEQVKRIARELLNKYPNKFSADFEKNKKLVNEYTNISSTKVRNKVAGYTARLASTLYGNDESEDDTNEE